MKLLVGALLVLALAGCASAEGGEPAAEGHGSSSEESPGPVSYPVGWPTDELPLLDGTLLHFGHPGNLWAGWVESTDLVADLATATQLLVDAGYTITLQADGYIEFSNADRMGRVVAAVDDTWGPCLLYTFTDGTTLPDPSTETTEAPASEH